MRTGPSLKIALTLCLSTWIACATSVPELDEEIPPSANAAELTDIADHPAVEEIRNLRGRGIVAGFADGTFRPQQVVTRAQYAALIDRAFLAGVPAAPAAFSDVPASHWAAGAIGRASAAGFLRGYPDGSFKPEQSLTRVEGVVAVVNGLKLGGGSWGPVAARFADAGSVPDWARTAVGTALQYEFFSNAVLHGGDGSKLAPAEAMTRGAAASLIYEALVAVEATSRPTECGPGISELQCAAIVAGICTNDETEAQCLAKGVLSFVEREEAAASDRGQLDIAVCRDPGPGWIRASEAPNWRGHTIRCHVGWGDQQLRARLAGGSVNGCGVVPNARSIGSFSSIAEAERGAIQTILDECQIFHNWLFSAQIGGRLPLMTFTAGAWGRVCVKPSDGSNVYCRAGRRVTAVWVKTAEWRILGIGPRRARALLLTSYPTPGLPF